MVDGEDDLDAVSDGELLRWGDQFRRYETTLGKLPFMERDIERQRAAGTVPQHLVDELTEARMTVETLRDDVRLKLKRLGLLRPLVIEHVGGTRYKMDAFEGVLDPGLTQAREFAGRLLREGVEASAGEVERRRASAWHAAQEQKARETSQGSPDPAEKNARILEGAARTATFSRVADFQFRTLPAGSVSAAIRDLESAFGKVVPWASNTYRELADGTSHWDALEPAQTDLLCDLSKASITCELDGPEHAHLEITAFGHENIRVRARASSTDALDRAISMLKSSLSLEVYTRPQPRASEPRPVAAAKRAKAVDPDKLTAAQILVALRPGHIGAVVGILGIVGGSAFWVGQQLQKVEDAKALQDLDRKVHDLEGDLQSCKQQSSPTRGTSMPSAAALTTTLAPTIAPTTSNSSIPTLQAPPAVSSSP